MKKASETTRETSRGAYYTATFGHKKIHVYRRLTPSGNPAYMAADTSEVDDKGKVKRVFRSFSDEAQAKLFADKLAERLGKRESTAMRLSEAEAIEYVGAQQHLRALNITVGASAAKVAECIGMVGSLLNLSVACQFYLDNHKTTINKRVSEVVELMLASKADCSKIHVADLRTRLGRFAEDFQRDLSRITTANIAEWLDNLKLNREDDTRMGPVSRRNFWKVLHALFAFGMSRGFCATNPVVGVQKAKLRSEEVGIFTPVEIARLLEAARTRYPDFLPALAISAFAGLRSAEVERIGWADIDFADRQITVSAGNAKTASRRLVPIQDNLLEWLKPYAGRQQGKVWPHNSTLFYRRQQQITTATTIAADDEKGTPAQRPVFWKSNGLRHSFASYRFAILGDAGRTAAECGNSASVIHKHYKELVKLPVAERWFAVRPPTDASNVVPMPAAAAAATA